MSYIFQTAREELQRQVARHASYISGNVLDVGGGSISRYKKYFTVASYTNMEVSAGPNIDLVGKAEAIPSPDNAFDSIVCTQVLGDVYEVAKAIKEFNRVLKPGGHVLVTCALFDPLVDEPNDYWRFTPYSLERLFSEVGFEIVLIEKRGGFFSVMSQMTIRYLIERFDIYNKWYRKIISGISTLTGKASMWLDSKDKSNAGRIFSHGYIVIAKKP